MRTCRLHIMGASGAGVTTLGRALADALAIPHHDADDYYWQPTSPPYRDKRVIADRLRLMRELFLDRGAWVLSGSLDGWGDPLVPFFDRVLFVLVPTEVRLQRLRAREARRFGADATAPGGWRHRECEEFIEWASHYDDGTREGRNLKRHETWLAGLPCPVLRIDGTRATREMVEHVLADIGKPVGWVRPEGP
jgi:adenylate kinase family enzyme